MAEVMKIRLDKFSYEFGELKESYRKRDEVHSRIFLIPSGPYEHLFLLCSREIYI